MRPLKNSHEIAVIGGGLAGLSAACHAARLGHSVTLFEGSGLYGGLVATTNEVDGLPMPGIFSGMDLAMHLLEAARKAAVQVVESHVSKIDPDQRLTLTDGENRAYRPEAIIVASGASLRKLGIPGEAEFEGRGLSRCATCDGGFYRGKDVVVVGGGDGAIHEALVLAKTSRQVTMVCRSPAKAKRIYLDKLAARENVEFIWDHEVGELLGTAELSGVRLRNVRNGTVSERECAGVFPFIGVSPNAAFVPAGWRTASGHIATGEEFATADPRVFAVGAVRANAGGNAVQAMAEGVGAAESAARLLSGS
jgi:thioredoxin reductase (NADPH)